MKETGLTGKRRSTTIAATPDDGKSQRKRRRRRLFGHNRPKTSMEKDCYMQGKMEGKRRGGRPATTRLQDLKEWTELDMADASHLHGDRLGKMAGNHQSHS